MNQRISPQQTLTETWEVTITRAPRYGKHEARLSWPHHTIYCLAGRGDSVEDARLDLITRLAKAIEDDDDRNG